MERCVPLFLKIVRFCIATYELKDGAVCLLFLAIQTSAAKNVNVILEYFDPNIV